MHPCNAAARDTLLGVKVASYRARVDELDALRFECDGFLSGKERSPVEHDDLHMRCVGYEGAVAPSWQENLAPTFSAFPNASVVAFARHGAALRRGALLGSELGIFVGLWNSDFAIMERGESVYAATGSQPSIASGRLAFALGTQGPTLTVDTACSSALVALNCAGLSMGACKNAVVSAVNLVLSPSVSVPFAAVGMLSGDGRCKTFDARANGYVRSEGVSAAALSGAAEDTAASIVAAANIAWRRGH